MAMGTQCPSDSTDPAIEALAAKSPPSAVPLPAAFKAVAVVRCETQLTTIASNGMRGVALAQRATGGLSALITALRLPSSSPPAGGQIACPAVGVVLPDFALVDAQGRILVPSLPHDECGNPLDHALAALNALPWKTETEQNVSQVQSGSS